MENPGANKVEVKKVHHVSIAVNDADKVIEKWSSMFGIGPWTHIDIGGTDAKGRPWKAREYHAQMGSVVIELIQPIEGRIVQSRFLDTFGPGLHHISFQVDDLEEALSSFLAQGAELVIKDPGRFAYIKSGAPDGVIIEISKHE